MRIISYIIAVLLSPPPLPSSTTHWTEYIHPKHMAAHFPRSGRKMASAKNSSPKNIPLQLPCHSSGIAFIAGGALEKVINSSIIPNRPLDKSHWHLHLSTKRWVVDGTTNGWLIYHQFPVLESLDFSPSSSLSYEPNIFIAIRYLKGKFYSSRN